MVFIIESIAEYTEKPLYSINISELSSEQNVVARLEKIFELSVRWDAVLLIDEADVVLEKRSYENMHRNAVVSGMPDLSDPAACSLPLSRTR